MITMQSLSEFPSVIMSSALAVRRQIPCSVPDGSLSVRVSAELHRTPAAGETETIYSNTLYGVGGYLFLPDLSDIITADMRARHATIEAYRLNIGEASVTFSVIYSELSASDVSDLPMLLDTIEAKSISGQTPDKFAIFYPCGVVPTITINAISPTELIQSNPVIESAKTAGRLRMLTYALNIPQILQTIPEARCFEVFANGVCLRRYYLSEPTPNAVLWYTTPFGLWALAEIRGKITEKTEIDQQSAVAGDRLSVFDRKVTRTFEVQIPTGDPDYLSLIQDVICSYDIRLYKPDKKPEDCPEMAITESTLSIVRDPVTDSSVKFTIRYADINPPLRQVTETSIFKHQFNSVFL